MIRPTQPNGHQPEQNDDPFAEALNALNEKLRELVEDPDQPHLHPKLNGLYQGYVGLLETYRQHKGGSHGA